MFKAVKLLNLDRKYEAIKVEDKSGQIVAHPIEKLNIITNFFESKFQNSNKPFIEAFFGEPRKLKKPITKEEVRKSINKLNNNRAPGKGGIQGELSKYGPETIDSYIANIFNEPFEKHQILDINAGEIIPFPKPGKPKGPPKNLRPMTLLNTIRKTLSTIVLERIRPHVQKYISHSQSGFRPNRSTADVAWTHK
ncbi:RNA-directed DNA polymerase from mobile element jockey-like [Elysia marginata]|uniref:RNA-directed DNA polymerase from mobile element jockey-like n=1 Tax=Elysia marginata TaxID=1093978 RepID=A0AAV4HPF7_9GAST|nr:RNA-directed DNA polymerase from mobile element jockey-like [Elysia marginata]